jgi:sterol desaturase/sphingolipid hydroxylase (fatty acid hydroxylase superfamily)
MPLIKVIGFSFAVYIGSCIFFEQIRRNCPELSVQHAADIVTPQQRTDSIKTAIINLCVGALILVLISRWIRLDMRYNLIFYEMMKLIVMFFVADTMFYWSHRFLHIPEVYRIAHAQHHSHHEPVPWTSLFVHPIEFIIAFTCIFAGPLLLFKIHPITATLFLSGIMISLVSSHSGIRVGTLFDATHHDLHHQRRRGNYGSDFGIWDRICGTAIGEHR